MTNLLTHSLAWQDLARHRETLKAARLSGLALGDAERIARCEIALDGLRFNYALNFITPETIGLLVNLAKQQKVEDWRARMLRGDIINTTEKRAVLHTALRQKSGTVMLDGRNILDDVAAARWRMGEWVNEVRAGRWNGATGKPIKHIVNIGIGGSDLGPRLAARALKKSGSGLDVRFVANADAYDLTSALEGLDAAETLFVIVSKTFTTQETLLNAHTARHWLVDKLGDKAVAQHFVAVSANEAEVRKFGIDAQRMLPMWDWVGGRFSLWSAVGLSAAFALGMEAFDQMLDGAAAMDEHFRTAPLAQNMPVMLALLGLWNRNFLDAPAHAVLPYSERLRDLPRYLQQLEMESNGKLVSRDGAPLDYATAPVIFGDCGTVGQHSFHQWLHQGTVPVSADFLGVAEDDLGKPEHHRTLISNMVAQAGALAFGQTDGASAHDFYPGNRPGNILLLERLDPRRFGMLLALYEHKTFVQGVLWNLNSFDQPGVELGKRMARGLEAGAAAGNAQGGFLARLYEKCGSSGGKKI